MYRYTALNGT